MELRQLRHFAAVVAQGNFSRAARSLHLTQPALSRQIKNLEDELGVPLLIRHANKVTLTPSGHTLYDELKEILRAMDRAIQRVQKGGKVKPFRVGYMKGVVGKILPCVLSRFQKSHEGEMPKLFDLKPGELVSRAKAGKLDVILMPTGSEADVSSFQWTEIKLLERILVMPAQHPLARLKRIPPHRLSGQKLHAFLPSAYPAYADILTKSLGRFDVKPIIADQTADDLSSLFSALEADFGLAVVTEQAVPILPEGLTYRPFYPRLEPLPLLVGVSTSELSVRAEEFQALVAQAASEKNLKWR